MRLSLPTARRAFTLVEVILAILIICGIMTVLLYFYQRAAEVRQIALKETEFISTGRMLMEQITGELRTARVLEDQFFSLNGTSNSIEFICTALPAASAWLLDTNEPLRNTPSTDLKKIYYGLMGGTNLSETLGIERRERFLAESLVTGGTNLMENTSSNEFLALEDPTLTNFVSSTNLFPALGQPLTDKIKFLSFRYWDGTDWIDGWDALALPAGVEISIGAGQMPAEAETEGYPFELFRRVVFLPHASHPANAPEAGLAEEVLAF